MTIFLKRIYESAEERDGYRVLVDRLWPRGVSKNNTEIDLWLKDAAPSTVLRKWFNHEPEKWSEFKTRYFAELDTNRQFLKPLIEAAKAGSVTLVYASRDKEHNGVVCINRKKGRFQAILCSNRSANSLIFRDIQGGNHPIFEATTILKYPKPTKFVVHVKNPFMHSSDGGGWKSALIQGNSLATYR